VKKVGNSVANVAAVQLGGSQPVPALVWQSSCYFHLNARQYSVYQTILCINAITDRFFSANVMALTEYRKFVLVGGDLGQRSPSIRTPA